MTIESIIDSLNGIVWGPWTPCILVAVGVYFTLGTKFLQVRKFGFVMRETLGKIFEKTEKGGEGTLTPFQAAASALASTIGVGSIIGVATAIGAGGPGALFWMWVSAFFGMCTKYAEILLSIEFREKNDKGNYVGGPAFYMKKGLKSPFLAVFFTIMLALGCLGGNMVQANSIAGTVTDFFNINPYITGIILIVTVGIVCLGGVKMLGKVAEKLVPLMSVLYVGGGLLVLIFNFKGLPGAFTSIFQGAFATRAVAGGVGGYTLVEAMRYGIARGLYSNEAGSGSAPIAHATAITDHPARQGMWGIFEVFAVTIIICTITGLSILTSGAHLTDTLPIVWTSSAYATVFPALKYVVGISLVLFAYTTIIGIEYYGESLVSVFVSPICGKIYKYIFIPFTFIGAIGGLKVVWGLVDLTLGLYLYPNLIAIVLLYFTR